MPFDMKRFSIKSVLLVVTLLALVLTIVISNLQHRNDAIELAELRNVAGRLAISDPNLVHAIPVPLSGKRNWQWQIYLPEEKDYQIVLVTGDRVPITGPPERWSGRTPFRRSGKFMLTAAVEKEDDGEWVLTTEAHGRTFSHPIGNTIWGSHQKTGIKSGTTTAGIAGRPLELLRIRTPESVNPPNGIMILIEEYDYN